MDIDDITYEEPGPSRDEVNLIEQPLVLNFGSSGCGYCQAAKSAIAEALSEVDGVQYVGVEDGPGRKLGRSFGVKLWPTLVFMKKGEEASRVVRPEGADEIRQALRTIV